MPLPFRMLSTGLALVKTNKDVGEVFFLDAYPVVGYHNRIPVSLLPDSDMNLTTRFAYTSLHWR